MCVTRCDWSKGGHGRHWSMCWSGLVLRGFYSFLYLYIVSENFTIIQNVHSYLIIFDANLSLMHGHMLTLVALGKNVDER